MANMDKMNMAAIVSTLAFELQELGFKLEMLQRGNLL